MANLILKLLSNEKMIEFLINYLASLVKNPQSPKAQRLKGLVATLHGVTEEFIKKVF
jgi:hypothetical protein